MIGGSPENEVDKSEGYVPQVLKSAGNKYDPTTYTLATHLCTTQRAHTSVLCRTVDKYVPVSATSDLLTEITPSYIPKLLNKNATRCVRLPLSPMYLRPPTKLPIVPLISMCRLKSRPHHPSPPQLDHLTSPRSTHIAHARLTLYLFAHNFAHDCLGAE